MTRNDVIRATGELIDALRPIVYAGDTPAAFALLGNAERFCNRLTDARRANLITMRDARTTLTVLRLRASRLNAYHFRRSPSVAFEERHRNWPI